MKRRSAIKSLSALVFMGIIPDRLFASGESVQNKKIRKQETDILIVGAGTAGIVAAIQAGRAGCKTILLECGSQPGGTMTTGGVAFPGLFHAWGRQVIGGIGWELVSESVTLNGDILPDFTKPFGRNHSLHQIKLNASVYALLSEEKCLRSGCSIRYYETPVKITRHKDRWEVDVAGKGTHYTISCKQLIDCTGNAFVAAMAGYEVLKEKETQPGSFIFELSGYDPEKLNETELKQRLNHAIEKGELYKTDAYNGIMNLLRTKGGLASQHVMNADSTTSATHTLANIEGRASMLRIIRFVKTLPGCERAYISKMQPETAIRETYRINGLYRITHEDYTEGKLFYDSLSYSYYPIDLHVEEGVRPKHLKEGTVATIPLRALIPKNGKNIMVAGRCISSDRLANSALRVQASCMGMGQIAGATAVLACKQNVSPLEVSLDEIKELIKIHNGIIPS